MSRNNKRPVYIIFLIIFVGCILGSALSSLVNAILTEGNVLKFFQLGKEIGFGDNEAWLINSEILKFKLGFKFDVSILSILGMGISWYFLRFFK